MNGYLLDVNVLLALSDPQHIHHDLAHDWFAVQGRAAWATCPITENAFVRITSHPTYPSRPGEASVVLALLREMCAVDGHRFWADDLSIRTALASDGALTHAQVTDVYLLGLAIANGGRLATFDRRIPATLVADGPAGLEVIPA
ncbi:MAG: VapC toxin family PIN domain ribonuclease [Chloroflexi bacterium]|nr:VapC toxin family PIN domain ribonuclease [Chloroflexota bacterium]